MITYGPDFYVPKKTNVPSVFIEADKQLAELHKDDPKPLRKPKKIPMPFISGCPGAEPVVFVTEDWYVKHEKKRLKRIAENKRDAQVDMMELLSEKDRIKRKLGELRPYKKKDCKKIVKLNIKLRDIDAELEALQSQFKINVRRLEKGTRFDRFIGSIKRGFKKVVKKVKSFFKDNKELVGGIASIGIPAVIGLLIKKFIGGATPA